MFAEMRRHVSGVQTVRLGQRFEGISGWGRLLNLERPSGGRVNKCCVPCLFPAPVPRARVGNPWRVLLYFGASGRLRAEHVGKNPIGCRVWCGRLPC